MIRFCWYSLKTKLNQKLREVFTLFSQLPYLLRREKKFSEFLMLYLKFFNVKSLTTVITVALLLLFSLMFVISSQTTKFWFY